MELDDVRPAEVVFKKKLFASEFSEIFLTVVRGQQCVMKVVRALSGPLITVCSSWYTTNYKVIASRTRSTTIL